MYHMYPRGRKVCFATAGFLLIAKTRVYLRPCGIPTGKKRAGLACGIGNILRAGRPSGGQPSFSGRLAGRREAAAKRGTGNAPWRRRKEGRRGGRRCFAGPAGRQNQSRGRGPFGPPPLLCARCARPPPPRGAAKIGFPFIRGRRNGRHRYDHGHGNHGPPCGHGRDGRTGPEDHRPACRPTDPPPLGPRLLSRRRTG